MLSVPVPITVAAGRRAGFRLPLQTMSGAQMQYSAPVDVAVVTPACKVSKYSDSQGMFFIYVEHCLEFLSLKVDSPFLAQI